MKRKDTVILNNVIPFVIILMVLFFVFACNSNKQYSWSKSYRQNSDQPFGTQVVSDLLEGYFEGHAFEVVRNNLEEKLKEEPSVHKNYIFIGQEPYLTDSTYEYLINFVYEGNDAFLAVSEVPDRLSNYIFKNVASIPAYDSVFYTTEYGDTVWYTQPHVEFDSSAFSYFTSDNISMNFLSPVFRRDSSFEFHHIIQDKSLPYNWRYFVPAYANTLVNFDSLGSLHSKNFLNYIKIPYGKGNFYIHSNPLVFTNFFQIQEKNIEYTSKVFSYLKPGDIIWDEASKTYNYGAGNSDDNFSNESEGPLKFILSQDSLRWAWYLLLAGLLVFILFRTKRVQQAIPVLERNENKSLEFIQTIGRMYFMSKNHKLIAQQKMKLFLHFINDRYRIPTQELKEEFYNKLNLKSEISGSDIKAIFSHYRYLENTLDVTPDDLIYFHQLLDSFYKNCK